VVALDASTGKTIWESVGEKNWQGQSMRGWPGDRTVIWKKGDKQASYSSQIAAIIDGQRHIFCLMRQGLVSLNPTNGAVNFSRWFRAQVEESVNASCPVVVGDQVVISSAYYKTGTLLLRVKPRSGDFEELWKGTTLEMHWSTPIHHAGYLYGFSGRNEPDARFRCIELKTGKLMWDRDESWPPHSSPTPPVYGRGSAIFADGKLIVLGEGGMLGLFQPNPAKPEEISRWQVPQLHYPCWAAPALSRQRLYLRNEDHLICVNLAR
jgi:outer membrane protein assembly factor BamB